MLWKFADRTTYITYSKVHFCVMLISASVIVRSILMLAFVEQYYNQWAKGSQSGSYTVQYCIKY